MHCWLIKNCENRLHVQSKEKREMTFYRPTRALTNCLEHEKFNMNRVDLPVKIAFLLNDGSLLIDDNT